MATVADTARARCSALLIDPVLESLAPAIERALDRLDKPLVVAVTGHVSAGKSTLINALAGRPVTETGATETTLVSWWLRRGTEERVLVKRRGAAPLQLAIGDDLALAESELDLDAPEPITVWLNSHLLDDLVLVDTPGLFSPNAERSERARVLVHAQTDRAAAGADAVVHVTSEAPGAKREAAELDAFAAGFPDLGHAPTNALIVMTKADRYWPASDDPRATAGTALDSARAAWRSRAWQAIPVAALLAQTAPLGEADREILRTLAAGEAPDTAVRLMAARARSGRAAPAEADLLRRLGPYGVAVAARAVASAADPVEALRAASGIDEVRRAIDELFRARTQTMRTDRMLRELEALSFGRDVPAAASARLRSAVDDVRAGQDGGGLRVLLALRLAADPRVRLSDEARDDVRAAFAVAVDGDRHAITPDAETQPMSRQFARERAHAGGARWRWCGRQRPTGAGWRPRWRRHTTRSRAVWTTRIEPPRARGADSFTRVTASPQAPVTLPAAARLNAAKRLAKASYALARDRGSAAVPARLQRAAQHTTAMARVAVVGERKRGKSTLVNALIGRSDLLPRDVDVATNTYIEVISPARLGLPAQPRARVHLQSGAVVDADISELGRWASEQSNPSNTRRVAYVQVLLPHPLLDAGLVLLDTPGLGGLLGAHGTMTLNALDESTALVLVLNAAAPATTDELAFLDRARRRVNDTLIVESAGPEATDADAVAAADRHALRNHNPAYGSIPVLVVSPLDAHDALTEADSAVATELRALSGIDVLARRLIDDVLEPELVRQSELLESEVLSCLDELAGPDRALVASFSGMDPKTALDRVQAELAAADRASPVAAFDGRFTELRREVDAAMQAQITAERDELLDRIEDDWSGGLANALPDLCKAMLARAATDAGARLAAGAGPLAATVAERHELGAVMTTIETPASEFRIDLPGRPKASRQFDQERMLGWLTRGGPILVIGAVSLNPVLVGIGVAVVAASEHIQGSTLDRRRAREYVQRAIARGQLELRTVIDERAGSVRTAFVDDLHTRHNARMERLRATVRALSSDADVDGARRRVAEVDRLQGELRALAGAGS